MVKCKQFLTFDSMKIKTFILALAFVQLSFGQVYQEVLPPEHIKTVQLFNPQTNDQTPVIRLGSEYLILSFDDLNAGYQEYNYKIEHYNADWTPSGIFQSEFLDGYSSNYIQNYTNSFNTYQSYTNYQVTIPNKDLRLKLPGNYVVKVYTKDEDNPIFTRRFAVYDARRVNIGLQTERAIGSGDLTQRINVTVSSAQQNLTETPDGAYLFIMKNNNWEDNLILQKPQFIQASQLTYKDNKNLFEGGSEYLWFDTKNIETGSLTTERVFQGEDGLWHTVLRSDFQKYNLGYFDENDINGSFYIRNVTIMDQTRSSSEADYTWVHFALDEFNDQNGALELYIVGAFNNWQIDDQYRLQKSSNNLWEVSLLLKQGYYNYQYAVKNTKTGKVSMSKINGSFWQTENLYQALFYYRPWGVRYDLLMSYGEVSTR